MDKKDTLKDIRKGVLLQAPIEKVWKVIATSDGIKSWWMPNTFEAKLGYEFILHAGQFGDSPCKVTELIPESLVGFEWGKDWHLTFELKKVGDNTEFTLNHSGWDADKVTEFGQSHSVIHNHMGGGWEKIIKEKLPSVVNVKTD